MIVRLTVPVEIDESKFDISKFDMEHMYNMKLEAISKLADTLLKEAYTDLAYEVELEIVNLPYVDD